MICGASNGNRRGPTSSCQAATVRSLCFFTVTLDRRDPARRLTVVREQRPLPGASSVEGSRFCSRRRGSEVQAALATVYRAGLRVSEMVALRVADIDPNACCCWSSKAEGRGDSHAILSPEWLELLRALGGAQIR
jgi:integrase